MILFCVGFLFLGIAIHASAATYYVATNGSDSNDGLAGTTGDGHGPKLTIQAALNIVGDDDIIEVAAGTYAENLVFNATQNGKSIMIHGASATTVTLTKDSGYVIKIEATYDSGDIVTFSDMTITGTGTANISRSYGNAALVFNSDIIGDMVNTGFIYLSSTTLGGSLTFTGCTLSNANTSYAISLGLNQGLNITGGTITTGAGNFVQASVAVGNLVFDSITIDSTRIVSGYMFFNSLNGTNTGTVTVRNNIITAGPGGGFLVNRGSGAVSVTGNVITNTSNTTAAVAISVGVDGTTSGLPKMGVTTITDNIVSFTGTAHSHGIEVGRGVTAGTLTHNTITGADNGIVVKSDNVTVSYNKIVGLASGGLSGLYIRGGSSNLIVNNTFQNLRSLAIGIQIDTQDAVSSENTDAIVPSNPITVAVAAAISIIGEDGNVTLLASGLQPPVEFRPRIILKNPSAGSLNLHEGITTFAISGTHGGSAVSENITFTSSVGNKAVAAGKYRYKSGVNLYDSISSITVDNIPDGAITVSVGTIGVAPVGNQIKNNVFSMAIGNTALFIEDMVGTSDGNAKNNIFDYNIYQLASGNIASLNYGETPPTILASLANLQSGWATYSTTYPNNDAYSITSDPEFTSSSNFSLQSVSPAIDAGTVIAGVTTDYAGNSIYGLPDIGAYEYQPPYTIGTDEVDVNAEVRVYADGKFRNIGTAGGTTADLTITPNSGSFTSDTSAWLDITDITWNTTGDYSKQWTESSTFSGLTNTVHTIGDLEANTYYNITVDSSTTNLSGTNCNTAGSSYTCLSNSSGEITFTYTGTYSTHIFDVTEGDNTVPAISGVTSAPTSTGATITWNTDEASSSLVEYGLTSSYGTSTSEADTGTRVTSHSVLLSGLSTCTRYYYRVHSKDATTNESIVVGNSFITTECGGGGLPSGAYTPPTSPTGGFKVSVNSNAETTNSPNVTLSLTAGTDTKNMAISNLPDFQNATQEPYQPTKQWDLCQQRTTCPAGQYTVYVKFYTQYGQVSETIQDTISYTGANQPTKITIPTQTQIEIQAQITQIKQQLISLITQLIQMLYLEVEQMRG